MTGYNSSNDKDSALIFICIEPSGWISNTADRDRNFSSERKQRRGFGTDTGGGGKPLGTSYFPRPGRGGGCETFEVSNNTYDVHSAQSYLDRKPIGNTLRRYDTIKTARRESPCVTPSDRRRVKHQSSFAPPTPGNRAKFSPDDIGSSCWKFRPRSAFTSVIYVRAPPLERAPVIINIYTYYMCACTGWSIRVWNLHIGSGVHTRCRQTKI